MTWKETIKANIESRLKEIEAIDKGGNLGQIWKLTLPERLRKMALLAVYRHAYLNLSPHKVSFTMKGFDFPLDSHVRRLELVGIRLPYLSLTARKAGVPFLPTINGSSSPSPKLPKNNGKPYVLRTGLIYVFPEDVIPLMEAYFASRKKVGRARALRKEKRDKVFEFERYLREAEENSNLPF